MRNALKPEIVISGVGITSAVGIGKNNFFSALVDGAHKFDGMRRPGRESAENFIGAELSDIDLNGLLKPTDLRSASLTAKVAVKTLSEAWEDAGLDDVDPYRIGLIIGGSNIQQRELLISQEQYRDKPHFLRPSYGMTFMDSDVLGLCTSTFGIKGLGYMVGGASASGQLAVIEAAEAVCSGRVDVCIAMGALMDLSRWECRAFRAIGAMGGQRFAGSPGLAYRPFDSERDGFVFGEACGVVVLAKATALSKQFSSYARLVGWSTVLDGNRYPDPSFEGESRAIEKALKAAGLAAGDIDYINPHGSGSIIGDETELKALSACGFEGKVINTTKSITGHGLTAAGAVEIVATVLQMKEGKVHPCRNLESPISDNFDWVRERSRDHELNNSLCLSMGFGGINSAVCLSR